MTVVLVVCTIVVLLTAVAGFSLLSKGQQKIMSNQAALDTALQTLNTTVGALGTQIAANTTVIGKLVAAVGTNVPPDLTTEVNEVVAANQLITSGITQLQTDDAAGTPVTPPAATPPVTVPPPASS